MHVTCRVMSLKPPWSMVKSTEQREQKAKCGPFFDDEIPGGNATITRNDQLFSPSSSELGHGELGGSDMIVENQTQTTELDSNF